MNDSERIDWLEETAHVLCCQGDWFCAWRGECATYWLDRPTSDSVRGAIDMAVEDVELRGYSSDWNDQ